MILNADSDGLFFNQTYTTTNVTALSAAKTPIASIKLVVDKNLTEMASIQYHYYFFYIMRNVYLLNILNMTSIQVDVNGKPIEHSVNYIFNFTNATECSNGARTFLSVPVNIYINATGEIHFYMSARLGNQSTGYQYASFSVTAGINNGI